MVRVRERLDTATALVVALILVGVGIVNLVAFNVETTERNFFQEVPNSLLGAKLGRPISQERRGLVQGR